MRTFCVACDHRLNSDGDCHQDQCIDARTWSADRVREYAEEVDGLKPYQRRSLRNLAVRIERG